MAMGKSALEKSIHDKLTEAGFEKVPGFSNTFKAPDGFAGSGGADQSKGPRMTREEDVDLPLGDTTSRRGVDDRLRLLIERVERLEEEKKGIGDDIKDVYLEAKAVGYEVKAMRAVIRLRKMAPDDRREMETILDLYKAALGLG